MVIPFFAPEVRRLALASQGWHPLVAVLALALGVALGYGVHLVHGLALAESESAARRLAGEADLVVQAIQDGMDEALYPLLARRPEVAVASPVVEVEAKIPGQVQDNPRRLKVLGLDIFRAGEVQPALAALPDPRSILRPDRIYLNPTAMAWLGVGEGGTVTLQSGIGTVALQVAGTVDLPGAPLGIMDIAGAQAAFGALGRLTRIDLRLRPGVAPDAAGRVLAPLLPATARLESPAARARATAEFSRAYRVNLDVLALVALFTGSLLVFSSQALAVVRRRHHLALLRTLGFSRRELLALLLAEALALGLAGGIIGLGLGQGLAALLLDTVGPNLGAGYFRDLSLRAAANGPAAITFFGLGLGAALLGSLVPALEAVRAPPARALHAGDEEELFARRYSPWPGLVFLILALAALLPPSVAGLPVFAYLAVALALLGAIALLPAASRIWLAAWARLPLSCFVSRLVPAQLALAQLRGAAGQLSLSLAPLVASVAVAAAMAIMVVSFRTSLESWLDRLLPADLYLRAGVAGDSAYLPADLQSRLAALPGVACMEFRRSRVLNLDAGKPPVVLLARRVDPGAPDRTLPMVGPWQVPAPGLPGAWISEAMADLYGWRLGQVVRLPLGAGWVDLQVAGVWRDYARSGGAIAMERDAYAAASGDRSANEAAVWLAPGTTASALASALAGLFPASRVDIELPTELKRLSLDIFDRTFAATYALEGAAVVVGLAGLSASFAALVLARRREFGVLRHLGFGRRQVLGLLAWQGMLLAGLALALGFALGSGLSLVLIEVVNRQSFHWSMDLAFPWRTLAGFAGAVLLLAAATAAAGGRLAMGREAVAAVREDW